MTTLFTLDGRRRLALGGAALLALGAAGGAGAVALTRPSIEMAPTQVTPINHLSQSSGIVSVRGRVAEIFGNRAIVQDGTGRTLIDTGRAHDVRLSAGESVLVQGRVDDGQLRPRFLVDGTGTVREIGPGHDHPHGPPPPPPGGPMPPPPGGPMPQAGPGAPPPPGPGAPPAPPTAPGTPAPGQH